jgi:hypothetical protein
METAVLKKQIKFTMKGGNTVTRLMMPQKEKNATHRSKNPLNKLSKCASLQNPLAGKRLWQTIINTVPNVRDLQTKLKENSALRRLKKP